MRVGVVAVMAAVMAGVCSANLLLNSGFETEAPATTWSENVDHNNWFGWNVSWSDSGYGVQPQAGAHAAMLSTWTGGGDGGIEQKPLVNVGTAYYLTGYWNLESAGYNGVLGGFVGWRDAAGAELSRESFSIDYTGYTPGEWNQFSAFSQSGVYAPAGSVRAEVQINGTVGGSATYIDSFDFDAIPEPTSAMLGLIGAAFLFVRRRMTK